MAKYNSYFFYMWSMTKNLKITDIKLFSMLRLPLKLC